MTDAELDQMIREVLTKVRAVPDERQRVILMNFYKMAYNDGTAQLAGKPMVP